MWHLLHLSPFSHLSHLGSYLTGLPNSFHQGVAILWQILKNIWRPSEVSGVVGVNAALGIMGVFFVGTPTCLIFKHEKRENLDSSSIHCVQRLIQRLKIQQAVRHVIVLNTYQL